MKMDRTAKVFIEPTKKSLGNEEVRSTIIPFNVPQNTCDQ